MEYWLCVCLIEIIVETVTKRYRIFKFYCLSQYETTVSIFSIFYYLGKGLNGKIILKLMSRKWNDKSWIRLIWIRKETSDGLFVSGDEYVGSVKCR
jgi:hypothetical protein